ncbi:kinase-like domain-containing protein [Scleroderma yunnanense]
MHTEEIPNLAGKILANRYLVTHFLGRGGWGFVYCAHDLSSHRYQKKYIKYAIKCIPKASLTGTLKQYLMREIYLHRLVSDSSPHVVTMRGAFQDNLHFYLVLDLCTRGNMATALYNAAFEGKDELIRRVFIQVLDGVEACHKRGVYHRDIKPENILFRNDGSACIADFGIATEDTTSTEFGVGTPLYLSPESMKDGHKRIDYSPRSADVWALGIVLINMVAGMCPWQLASLDDPSFQDYVCHGDSFFKRTLPMISEHLNKLLQRILHPSLRKRMTVAELRQEILSIKTFYTARKLRS